MHRQWRSGKTGEDDWPEYRANARHWPALTDYFLDKVGEALDR